MTDTTPRPLVATSLYLIVALGLSVGYWLLYQLDRAGHLSLDGTHGLLGAARGYGPALAALVAAWVTAGRQGLAEIGARLTRWRLPPLLYATALLLPLLATSVVVAIVALGEPERLERAAVNPLRLVAIFFVFALVDGPLGEEIGWRGFLLPRLLALTRPVTASLLVGVVWYLWHLPLFAADGSRTLDAAFLWQYLLLNLAYALLHTWLFLRSNGSALLAVLFHTAGNYFFFLGVSLFPGLRGMAGLRGWYVAVLCAFALVAAIDLARAPKPAP